MILLEDNVIILHEDYFVAVVVEVVVIGLVLDGRLLCPHGENIFIRIINGCDLFNA